MILGQSAGIAAALAREAKRQPCKRCPIPRLRERLLAQKAGARSARAARPAAANRRPDQHRSDKRCPASCSTTRKPNSKGAWTQSANFKPHIGTGYLHDDKRGDGHPSAIFRFKAPTTGRYDLRIAYSPHETRADESAGDRQERRTENRAHL